MMSIGLLFIGFVMTVRRADFEGMIGNPELRYLILILPASIVIMYVAYGRYIDRCVARGRPVRVSLRFAEALFEVSAVTGAVAMFCVVFGATEGLLSPPSYLYPVLLGLLTLSLDPRACLLAGAVGALEYCALYFLLREQVLAEYPNTLLSTMTPYLVRVAMIAISGAIGALVAFELKRRSSAALRSAHERGRLRQVFGQHVSPAVAQAILEAGDDPLQPESRRVCIMFLDLRGFTKFSESRSPDEIMRYLNALLEPLMECVSEHGGIVNKLLGDGFMAIFGAPRLDPQPERGAVAAAREQLEIVARLVREGAIPPTRIGVGLHAGPAVTGNIGSARRKEYTVIGDTVNLAARVEALNKRFDAQVLATASVVEALEEPQRRRAEVLGEVEIRGRAAPVRLFRLA